MRTSKCVLAHCFTARHTIYCFGVRSFIRSIAAVMLVTLNDCWGGFLSGLPFSYVGSQTSVTVSGIINSTMSTFDCLPSDHLLAAFALNREVAKFMFSHAPTLPPQTRISSLNKWRRAGGGPGNYRMVSQPKEVIFGSSRNTLQTSLDSSDLR